MPIGYKSSAADNNGGAGNVTQFAVARPAGVVNGDFLFAVIGIASGATYIVTPPPGWTEIRRVDASTTVGLVTYFRFASNEPSIGWTWTFSGAAKHSGAVVAYTGVDPFFPIDAEIPLASALSTTPATPAATSSLGPSVAVGGFAANGTASFSAVAGETLRVSRSQVGASVALYERPIGAPGAVSAISAALGAGAVAVADMVVLRPSPAKALLEQVRSDLKANFPPGAEDYYDWDNVEADVYRLTQASAQFLKTFGYDYVDLLAREFQPPRCANKLIDWEGSLGITTNTANIPNNFVSARQARVLAKLREQGAFTLPNIVAAVEPLLGYAGGDIGTLVVLEADRAALRLAHTYKDQFGGSTNVAATRTFVVADDGVVSASGVQLLIDSPATDVDFTSVSFTLTNADASVSIAAPVAVFGLGDTPNARYYYNVPGTSGKTVRGTWTLTMSGTGGGAFAASLFVEGIGRDSSGRDGLGAGAFEWGVFADQSKVNSPDYVSARQSLARITPAFAVPALIRSIAPWPDVTSGIHMAIPDECIPV